jgi:Domain of unknown function (DUF1877)
MGLDMRYQAIPVDCDLIERAGNDPAIGELLGSIAFWYQQGGRGRGEWPEADQLWRYLSELALRFPGLNQRNLYLAREWDRLHYLLSATRRGEKSFEQDRLLDTAIRGGSDIGANALGTQGIPVRYVRPDDVVLIAVVLDSMTNDDLRVHYSSEKMQQSNVYKFWADRADESEWGHIAKSFEVFRAFYVDVAMHQEGVIACLD